MFTCAVATSIFHAIYSVGWPKHFRFFVPLKIKFENFINGKCETQSVCISVSLISSECFDSVTWFMWVENCMTLDAVEVCVNSVWANEIQRSLRLEIHSRWASNTSFCLFICCCCEFRLDGGWPLVWHRKFPLRIFPNEFDAWASHTVTFVRFSWGNQIRKKI